MSVVKVVAVPIGVDPIELIVPPVATNDWIEFTQVEAGDGVIVIAVGFGFTVILTAAVISHNAPPDWDAVNV